MSNAKQSTRGSSFVDAFLAKQRADIALRNLKAVVDSDKILDIGCGSYPFFLEQVAFKEKFGLDPMVDSTVDVGAIKLVKQSFVGSPLPFESDFFDAVTLLAVAEHLYLADDQLLFADVFRCLKPGAVFILTTPTPWTDNLLRFLANIGLISKEEIAEHKVLLPIKLLKRMLIEAGFSEGKISFGYFELGMNQWVAVSK